MTFTITKCAKPIVRWGIYYTMAHYENKEYEKMLLTDHGLQNNADMENNTIIMHINAAIAHRVISAMKDFA